MKILKMFCFEWEISFIVSAKSLQKYKEIFQCVGVKFINKWAANLDVVIEKCDEILIIKEEE